MKTRSLTSYASVGRALAVALAVLFSAMIAQAGERVILQFNPTQGYGSLSGLTSDSAGNLYGATSLGGSPSTYCGTAFELSPGSAGKWTETVLFEFQTCTYPGLSPIGAMVFDKQGNLYGVNLVGFNGGGEIFQLSKGTTGAWSYSVVHTFSTVEGSPNGDLTWDSAGNLYGTTSFYQTTFDGEAFELSPQPDGSWKETVLYTFPAPNGVGQPSAGVIFDSKGNLYGPASLGVGGSTGGVIYELSPQANGPWTLTVLYNGGNPTSRLTFDSTGNLYGTSNQINGDVFELSQTSAGKWTETIVHSFASGSDGSYPVGPLVIDGSGSLYGTTTYGGVGCSQSLCGVVYKLTPQGSGMWKETIVHPFESAGDGSQPQQGLFLDSAGNLFGTTYVGGSRYGYGAVYEITP